jgi:protein phosphatase
MDVSGLTHAGKVRPNNEDNFHIVQFGRYLRALMSSLPAGELPEEIDQPGYGFVVADGLGGRAGGEVASRLAITLLIEYALQTPDWILGQDDKLLARIMDRSAQRFKAVNEAIMTEALAQPGLGGMGTTLSVALSLCDDLIISHIGDSPIYLFRAGELNRLTRDHTTLLRQLGPGGDNAARIRRALTRAIGHHSGADPDIQHYKLADGDRVLLCTDGLTDMVDHGSIARVLGQGLSAEATCRSLVDLALDRGGLDNVTVIVAAYHLPGPAGPAA